MTVAAVGGGLALFGYRALAPRSKSTAGLVAGVLVVLTTGAVTALRSQRPERVERLSLDQPPGVLVEETAAIELTREDDGKMLVIRDRTQRAFLTIRTLTSAIDVRNAERIYLDEMRALGATVEGAFQPAPLPFTDQARGLRLQMGDRHLFTWMLPRAPDVATFFQCVTSVDQDPKTACDVLLDSASLDPAFVPRMD